MIYSNLNLDLISSIAIRVLNSRACMSAISSVGPSLDNTSSILSNTSNCDNKSLNIFGNASLKKCDSNLSKNSSSNKVLESNSETTHSLGCSNFFESLSISILIYFGILTFIWTSRINSGLSIGILRFENTFLCYKSLYIKLAILQSTVTTRLYASILYNLIYMMGSAFVLLVLHFCGLEGLTAIWIGGGTF